MLAKSASSRRVTSTPETSAPILSPKRANLDHRGSNLALSSSWNTLARRCWDRGTVPKGRKLFGAAAARQDRDRHGQLARHWEGPGAAAGAGWRGHRRVRAEPETGRAARHDRRNRRSGRSAGSPGPALKLDLANDADIDAVVDRTRANSAASISSSTTRSSSDRAASLSVATPSSSTWPIGSMCAGRTGWPSA